MDNQEYSFSTRRESKEEAEPKRVEARGARGGAATHTSNSAPPSARQKTSGPAMSASSKISLSIWRPRWYALFKTISVFLRIWMRLTPSSASPRSRQLFIYVPAGSAGEQQLLAHTFQERWFVGIVIVATRRTARTHGLRIGRPISPSSAVTAASASGAGASCWVDR